MSKTPQKQGTSRQAKIQAAQKSGRSGANPIVIGTVVAIVAIIAVVAFVVLTAVNKNGGSSASGTALPPGASAMGKGLVADADVTLQPGAPTLDVYEDFQCPYCGDLEHGLGSTIESLAAQGKIRLAYHIMTFLDDNLGNDASVRAAEGAFCAAAGGKFLEYHNQVYSNQPTQEGAGWTDAQLATFASNAGLTGSALTTWKSCTAADTYAAYIASIEKQSSTDGVTGTPTVKLNGTDLAVLKTDSSGVTVMTPAELTAAVQAATKS